MTRKTFDDIGFDRSSHRSALYWLGLLYRKPVRFRESLEKRSRPRQTIIGVVIFLHGVPYILSTSILIRLIIFGVPGTGSVWNLAMIGEGALSHITGVAFGVAFGIAVGTAFRLTFGTAIGTTVGVAFAITIGTAVGIIGGSSIGTAFWIVFGVAFWIAFGIAFGATTRTPVQISFVIVVGVLVGIMGIALQGTAFIVAGALAPLVLWRLYYYALHPIFFWRRTRGEWYPYHPVAWDDMCSLSFPFLERLLVAYAGRSPVAADKEIERLSNSYPSHRHSALRAKSVLLARAAACTEDLAGLDGVIAALPEGNLGFLSETQNLRGLVHEISVIQARIDTVSRPVLREPIAHLLCATIESFQDKVGRLHEPLATEFSAAASLWRERADEQLKQVRSVLAKEPTRQVFRAGESVDRSSEAFVPRHSVLGELERQIMLSTGCPGLVLYGRRRSGKSTLIANLAGFLPPSVRTVSISMQDPNAFTTLDHFVAHVDHSLRILMPNAFNKRNITKDLTGFFQMLTAVNEHLKRNDWQLLLALDEYENIDRKIGEGVLSSDLLATFRESIQVHRRIIWAFVGSHEITELENAPWTSYLVSLRTVEVPLFTLKETRLLLTEPLKYSTQWSRDDPSRPRFDPDFWGDGGIERIYAETGGWPHLVQLVAETMIDLLNDKESTRISPHVFEQALEKAIISGHATFYELLYGESVLPGEWEYLIEFLVHDLQPPPRSKAIFRSLKRRLLIVGDEGQWRLRVPLMARWLRERG